MNERAVCHRSEDLVTYLYNEASAADAKDFAGHLETCEACRAEFAVFNQVHESILVWRHEALGASFNPAAIATKSATDSSRFVHHERKLSAFAALREFFSVSPRWLRGATALAALLLCMLAVLTIARLSQRQPQIAKGTEPTYSRRDIDQATQNGIEEGIAIANRTTGVVKPRPENRNQLADNQSHSRSLRARGLTRQERIQLAADLRLTPGRDDEELPFVFPDEPNSFPDEPNQ